MTDGAMSDDRGRVLTTARCLAVDRWTVEVVRALRSANIEPLLLKGPATVGWLYRDAPGVRGYVDADLLVAPDHWNRARATLERLEFVCLLPLTVRLPMARRRHAESWRRAADGAAVDLHACIHRTEHLDRRLVWETLSRSPERIDLFGTDIEVPSESVRTLHVVLNVPPDDKPGSKAWGDLVRAIEQVSVETWTQAAAVATELGVEAEMGALLRFIPAGRELAEKLGLPAQVPDHRLDVHGSVHAVASRHVVGKFFPPPEYVRAGWPFARRGPLALSAAYAWRLLLVPARPVLRWRSRRAARRHAQVRAQR